MADAPPVSRAALSVQVEHALSRHERRVQLRGGYGTITPEMEREALRGAMWRIQTDLFGREPLVEQTAMGRYPPEALLLLGRKLEALLRSVGAALNAYHAQHGQLPPIDLTVASAVGPLSLRLQRGEDGADAPEG